MRLRQFRRPAHMCTAKIRVPLREPVHLIPGPSPSSKQRKGRKEQQWFSLDEKLSVIYLLSVLLFNFILHFIYLHFHWFSFFFLFLSMSTACCFISNNTGLLTLQIKKTKSLKYQEVFFPPCHAFHLPGGVSG